MEEVQKAVKMSRIGNARMRVQQVNTSLSAFLHQHDWAGELRLKERWKREIGRAISREIIHEILRVGFKIRALRQVSLREAEHESSEVQTAVEDLSKEQMVQEDDRRSNRRGAEKSLHDKWETTERNVVGQPSQGLSTASSGKKVAAGRTGGENYRIAARGV